MVERTTRVSLTCRVDPYHDGWTLMDYLCHRFRYLPRTSWEDRIADGRLQLNGHAAGADALVSTGDVVTYDRLVREPEVDLRYEIVFEDDDMLVVSKSGNIPVHAVGEYVRNTLIAQLRKDLGAKLDLAHRLDNETSGLIVTTKNRDAARAMASAFASGTVNKEYVAIVHGELEGGCFGVDAPVGKVGREHPVPRRIVDFARGKPARTLFEVVERLPGLSVLAARPLTGRTHQVRLHLEHVGHPVVGDKIYGLPDDLLRERLDRGATPRVAEWLLLPRHALHCRRMGFPHPRTGSQMSLESPLPGDMAAFIEERRGNATG